MDVIFNLKNNFSINALYLYILLTEVIFRECKINYLFFIYEYF